MKKTDVRVKRTYRQLMEALVSLLNEKNFDEISVIEICDKAEVHRATFYKHFNDKHGFLNACFRMKLDELVFDRSHELETPEQLKEACLRMFDQLMNFIVSNRNLLLRVIKDDCSYSLSAALNESITQFIASEINALKGHKKPDHIVGMISSYYAGAVVSLIKWWLNNPESCTKKQLMGFFEIKIDDFVRLIFS